jgi:hypothetical protein
MVAWFAAGERSRDRPGGTECRRLSIPQMNVQNQVGRFVRLPGR